MGALSAFFLALLGIGILILVHEWGHFWVARRVGLTVQEFSIGVGPSLLRWQGRDGVVYRLRLFFLFAGFVRIVEIEQDLLQKPTSPFARPTKDLLRRIAVNHRTEEKDKPERRTVPHMATQVARPTLTP